MSPEQVRGEEADHRSDIFAFGCVLYEMLSGRRAFRKETPVQTMNAILTEEAPDLMEANPSASPALERIARRCLEKEPERRFQSVSDLGFALESVTGSVTAAGHISPAPAERFKRESVAWMTAALACAIAATLVALLLLHRPAPSDGRPVLRVPIAPPEGKMYLSAALSPKGENLAFICTEPSRWVTQLWLRSLRSETAQPLPGTERATLGFWSPDGRWIGFFADGKLKKIQPAPSASALEICAAADGGGAWSSKGMILFANGANQPLFSVSANGGSPVQVTTLGTNETGHLRPYFLPDENHFLYLALGADAKSSGIFVGSLAGRKPKRILDASYYFAFAPPNYVLFASAGTLLGQRFNLERLECEGEQVALAHNVVRNIDFMHPFSVSTTGELVFLPDKSPTAEFIWYDRNGAQLGAVGLPGKYRAFSLSPDEQWLAFESWDAESKKVSIWLMDTTRGNRRPLPISVSDPGCPAFSPDGGTLVFTSKNIGQNHLYTLNLRENRPEQRLESFSAFCCSTEWATNNHVILDYFIGGGSQADVWTFSMDQRKAAPVMQRSSMELQAQLSPDGQWIAYASDVSGPGQFEIYVDAFPALGHERQISVGGGADPRWHREARSFITWHRTEN